MGGLKHFLKSISIEVVSKLTGYSFLGDLRQQFQIRDTVESQFLEPPGENQIGSRNREFEESKVASNYA